MKALVANRQGGKKCFHILETPNFLFSSFHKNDSSKLCSDSAFLPTWIFKLHALIFVLRIASIRSKRVWFFHQVAPIASVVGRWTAFHLLVSSLPFVGRWAAFHMLEGEQPSICCKVFQQKMLILPLEITKYSVMPSFARKPWPLTFFLDLFSTPKCDYPLPLSGGISTNKKHSACLS